MLIHISVTKGASGLTGRAINQFCLKESSCFAVPALKSSNTMLFFMWLGNQSALHRREAIYSWVLEQCREKTWEIFLCIKVLAKR